MDHQATPGKLEQLRRSAGLFQRTYHTPLIQLESFVQTLLEPWASITSAALTVEAIIFPPKHLGQLLARYRLRPELRGESTISATGSDEAHELLVAALGDWVDFYYVAEPTGPLVYADHDEYTTVFAARKRPLGQLRVAMAAAGFTEVPDYSRAV